MIRFKKGFALIFACVMSVMCIQVKANDVPAIAAASNIKFALDELVQKFTQDTGFKVRVSYGSSGNFVAQIKHGAPFQLFLSADEKYIKQLVNLGVTVDDGVLYAVGRLAIVAPISSPLQLDPELVGVKALIDSGKLKHFAIANPEHAPYGERAQSLLTHLGLWELIAPQLIYGENVSQAAQFAISGSTQGGIIALSLAISPQFQQVGHYQALPELLHDPIYQRMVLTNKAGPTAKAFYDYLQTDIARQVFSDFGFGLPVKAEGH
ncbi:molybdate ABC transporter substrate-binding protein [Shewanella sp. VB17]|uniref:molybdate ABC transporter substrate-binding protein n=1 Tax=Shewanella sp. VB17 TaxID=2739432 RepID=UPI0015673289|nr:molybdate ABC transporter substrate-binding protein [Shewanella sp. VB17]NRD71960.1 molybdate ABC transporter substrate-binding protein [Shewanella sp. VB17]